MASARSAPIADFSFAASQSGHTDVTGAFSHASRSRAARRSTALIRPPPRRASCHCLAASTVADTAACSATPSIQSCAAPTRSKARRGGSMSASGRCTMPPSAQSMRPRPRNAAPAMARAKPRSGPSSRLKARLASIAASKSALPSMEASTSSPAASRLCHPAVGVGDWAGAGGMPGLVAVRCAPVTQRAEATAPC